MTLPTSLAGFRINGNEPDFSPTLGLGWKPQRLLGKGASGIVGLWEYEGPETKAMKQIAIKQSRLSPTHSDPLRESRFMGTLSQAKSIHLVRQYRDAISEARVEGGTIVTMFLEFCPTGDLTRFMGRGAKILEVDLWAMFFCLACAGAAINRGTEDMASKPILYGASESSIVHYDLKPDNGKVIFVGVVVGIGAHSVRYIVFLGPRDTNHVRYPILKVGDFGNAQLEPKIPPDKEFYSQPRNRGAPGYKAPEDHAGSQIKTPYKGAPGNTFQLGCVMHAVMRRSEVFPASQPRSAWKAPFTKPDYCNKYTMGADLFSEPWKGLYSSSLRELIMECMMWEPTDRPESLGLQKRVLEGLKAATDIANEDKLLEGTKNPPIRNFDDVPMGSGRWETF